MYIGATQQGKRKWIATENGKRQIKQQNTTIIADTHTAIIEKSVFDKTQRIIDKGATSKNKNESTTISLKGVLSDGKKTIDSR